MIAHFHRNPARAAQQALTAVETLVSVAVVTIVLLLAMVACIGLRRSFTASDDYFRAQGDQTRILDYLSTDLRRCLAAASGTNSVSFAGTTYSNTLPTGSTAVLTAILPNYWDEAAPKPTPPATPVPRLPKITQGKVNYGAAPVCVTYFTSGSDLFRMEVDPDVPAGDPRNLPRRIAQDVADFASALTLPAGTASIANARVSFAPKFSASNWANSLNPASTTAARQGTTVATTVQLRNRNLNVGAGAP